ncbi:hypothetical protein LOTGIDRAFT_174593 [Lottia gigantea]|uniref:FLYWCH-type domain-containing protein n=1 Tax=Lottia gigantea TaxID=225164 RepID=V4C674_LOTGI|nr:hypothetical protein LOTGIDRAFT_174593 [Lottia gigantea]ESO97134.1 hypothetical protein LOTGIDRAFT_174593 [Lottia gigantea]
MVGDIKKLRTAAGLKGFAWSETDETVDPWLSKFFAYLKRNQAIQSGKGTNTNVGKMAKLYYVQKEAGMQTDKSDIKALLHVPLMRKFYTRLTNDLDGSGNGYGLQPSAMKNEFSAFEHFRKFLQYDCGLATTDPMFDADITTAEALVTFTVVESSTQRGKRKLVSSDGHSFTYKRRTKSRTDWRCSIRNKSVSCPVVVRQEEDTFSVLNEHTEMDLNTAVSLMNELLDAEESDASDNSDTGVVSLESVPSAETVITSLRQTFESNKASDTDTGSEEEDVDGDLNDPDYIPKLNDSTDISFIVEDPQISTTTTPIIDTTKPSTSTTQSFFPKL